ncbi:hypothetical protein K469DRAFT_588888, partial [Zopfia rhizophila CBS 207.26]
YPPSALMMIANKSCQNKTINAILTKATKEREIHTKPDREAGLFDNRWVLIKFHDQKDFQKPANAPIEPFKSDFIGATVDELGGFVKANFGEGGLGQDLSDSSDYIAGEVFGILDARTAKDDTLVFVVDDLVDAVDEAKIRVAWGNGTRRDDALIRYSDFEATNEDLTILVRDIHESAEHSLTSSSQPTDSKTEVSAEDVERLKKWYNNIKATRKDTWIELRLKADCAFWSIGGILYRGGLDYMLNPGDDFDKNGVMKADL